MMLAINIAGWSSLVARRAHNPKVVRFKSHSRNQKRKQSIWTAFSFLERCVPLSRNVMRTLCVMSASPRDVRFARIKEHITSLCAIGAIHHCAIALHHLPLMANITLYKRPKLCYNYLINAKGGGNMTKSVFGRHVLISSLLTAIAIAIIVTFCILMFDKYSYTSGENTSTEIGTVSDVYYATGIKAVMVEMSDGN